MKPSPTPPHTANRMALYAHFTRTLNQSTSRATLHTPDRQMSRHHTHPPQQQPVHSSAGLKPGAGERGRREMDRELAQVAGGSRRAGDPVPSASEETGPLSLPPFTIPSFSSHHLTTPYHTTPHHTVPHPIHAPDSPHRAPDNRKRTGKQSIHSAKLIYRARSYRTRTRTPPSIAPLPLPFSHSR